MASRPTSDIFPIFVRAEYQQGQAFASFQSDAQRAADRVKKEFQALGGIIDKALSGQRSGSGGLDLGIAELRQAAFEQQQRAIAAREFAEAALRAAKANGEFNKEMRDGVAAARRNAEAEERLAQILQSQIPIRQAIQAELNGAASAASVLVGRNLELAQAEAAAANGATLLAAIQRETGAGLDRTANSARNSAQAFELLFEAQSARSTVAAQSFFNTALGIDEVAKSARDSARAFEEMFAAQDRAKAEQESLASSAALLRAQLDPMFAAQQRFDAELARAERLYQAGAISAREYAAAQQLARTNLNATAKAVTETGAAVERAARVGTTARGSVINSVRAERTAFVQLGQQLQDVTVQAQLGTNAFQIFAQQAPQAAFALTGLADSTNKTKAAVGAFATFLSGPWGAAIFAATAVLGPYIASLFESGDAADEATTKTFDFVDGLDVLRLSAADAKAAIDQLSGSLRSSISLQGDFLRGEIAIAKQAAQTLQAQILADQRELAAIDEKNRGFGATILPQLFGADTSELRRASELRARIAQNQALLPAALDASAQASLAEANRNIAESADPILRQINEVDEAIARLNNLRQRSAIDEQSRLLPDEGGITQAEFERQLGELAQRREALEQQQRDQNRTPRSGGRRESDAEARRLALEAKRLAEFGREAALQIEAIQNRFVEIPPEVARVNKGVADLDALILELGERQPPDFQKLVDQAKELRTDLADNGIYDALDAAIDQLQQSTAEQLEQQRLILFGREEEAEVLRIMAGLQEQYGDAAASYRQDVEDIVALRRQEEDAMARIGEQIDAYRSATQSVRQELESLFSGEGFDLQQVFNRLRARLTVEQLFGDALRRIDNAVIDSFEGSAEGLEQNVERASTSFDRVGDAAEELAQRLAGVAALSTPNSSATFRQAFPTDFGAAGTIPSGGILNTASNDNEIIVNGAKAQRDGIGGMRPEAYAVLLGGALTAPLLDNLPPNIANALSPVLSQAIGGALVAGPVGGVLGGLNGLFGAEGPLAGVLSPGLTNAIGSAFGGAQTGQTVSGVLGALGIGNSSTGATIGGAVGSIIGPIGSLVGSIAGSLLGGLFGGTARGSAIIGGQGGSLGITGFYGGNDEREQASADLARTAIETVERLAEELGATVNSSAGRVSIGIREDSINVDPQGRGFTNTGRYSDIRAFGDDAEAAVLFAVQNLIEDGVIAGLSAAEQRLIQQGDDIEQAISDVLTFRSVFDRLEGLQNPLRAEIRALNSEFEDLIDLFERAGASAEEFASLEQLYDLERAKLIEEATDRIAGSLKSLIDDLTTGDNGLSLRSRRASALTEFESLRARVEAGDVSAFDDFESAARTLLDIERQIFGSQSEYFDRLEQVLAISRAAVAEQEALLAQGAGLGSPFDATGSNGGINPIGIPIAEQTAELVARLDAMNDNIGETNAILRSIVGASGGGRAGLIAINTAL